MRQLQSSLCKGSRPSQGCERTAHSESRGAVAGWRRDVHVSLRGLSAAGVQPCEGPPCKEQKPKGAILACPMICRAASLRKGRAVAASQGCDRTAHSESRGTGSSWRRDVHVSLRGLSAAGVQPCEGPPGKEHKPKGAILACPMICRAASLRKGTPPPQAVSMASTACSPNSAMAISRMTFLRTLPVAVSGKSLTKRM